MHNVNEKLESSDFPKVGVVLVNWNGGEFTIPCIRSLLESECKPWRILVVDNASDDDSPDEIASQFPEVVLIRNQENMGFAGGNNVGLRRLLEDGADFIWILNNDTIVDEKCLEEMLEAAYAYPKAGAFTCKIFYEKPPDRIWYAGADYCYWSLSAPHARQSVKERARCDQPRDVGFISGCSMLVKSSTLRDVGLFHDGYFMYDEDGEWCLRVFRAGLRMRYVPSAHLWHKVSATIRKNLLGSSDGTTSPMSHYFDARNRLFTIRLHADRPFQFLSAISYLVAVRAYRLAVLLLLGRWDKAYSVCKGVYDGFTKPCHLTFDRRGN